MNELTKKEFQMKKMFFFRFALFECMLLSIELEKELCLLNIPNLGISYHALPPFTRNEFEGYCTRLCATYSVGIVSIFILFVWCTCAPAHTQKKGKTKWEKCRKLKYLKQIIFWLIHYNSISRIFSAISLFDISKIYAICFLFDGEKWNVVFFYVHVYVTNPI